MGRSKKSKKLKDFAFNEFGQLGLTDDPQLVLDTNLDDMDGIVDTSGISLANARGSLGCSTASDSMDYSDRDYNQPPGFRSSGSYFDGRKSSSSPVFTDPFSNDRPLQSQQSITTTTSSIPSKLSPKSHMNPHLQRTIKRSLPTLPDAPRQDKSLPLLPPPGPSDGGSTLPSWFPPESWAVNDDNTVDYAASSDESDSWEILPEEDGISASLFKIRGSTSSKRLGVSSRPGKEFGLNTYGSGIGQWKRDDDDDDEEYSVGKPRSFSGPGSVIVRPSFTHCGHIAYRSSTHCESIARMARCTEFASPSRQTSLISLRTCTSDWEM